MATPCCPAPVSAMTRLLAHPHGQQGLAERVVDLVGAGVVQVFALQVDLRAAALLAQPLGVIQRRGAADVVLEQVGQLGLELRVALGLVVRHDQLFEGPHQRLGHIPPAECAETPGRVGRCVADRQVRLAAAADVALDVVDGKSVVAQDSFTIAPDAPVKSCLPA